jgi:hypothetical protein
MKYDQLKTKKTETIERILAARDLRLPDTLMTDEMAAYIEQMRECWAEGNAEAECEGMIGPSYRKWLLNQVYISEILENNKDALKKSQTN